MSESAALRAQENGNGSTTTTTGSRRRNCCKIVILVCVPLTIIFLVGVVLSQTVLKVRQPKTELVSATVEGASSGFSFPASRLEMNMTLNLTILVQNSNYASFKAGLGESLLLYKGNQVGDAELGPAYIPARGSANLVCLLTLELDRFADATTSFVSDIRNGEVVMEAKTRIPGRVNLLKIIRKHIVTTSDCQFVIGVLESKIKSQECKQHTKL